MKIIRQDGLSHKIYMYNSADIIDVSDYGKVKLVPRILPNESDTITVVLRQEISGKVFTPTAYFNYADNYFNLFIDVTDFKVGMKFEMEIFNNNLNIYKGKAMYTNKTVEDIQDFSTSTVVNNKIKY